VAGCLVPTTRVIVRLHRLQYPRAGSVRLRTYHEVDEVKNLSQCSQGHIPVIGLPSRRRNRQNKMRSGPRLSLQLGRIGIHRSPYLVQQQQKLLPLLRVLGILPIYIDPIEAQILDQLDAAIREPLAALGRRGRGIEVLLLVGIRPPANREQHLEIAVLPLQQVQLLEVAVEIVALVVPRVAVIVDLDVGPGVGEDHFAVGTVVAEAVEHVRQLGGRDVLREVFAAVDALHAISLVGSRVVVVVVVVSNS